MLLLPGDEARVDLLGLDEREPFLKRDLVAVVEALELREHAHVFGAIFARGDVFGTGHEAVLADREGLADLTTVLGETFAGDGQVRGAAAVEAAHADFEVDVRRGFRDAPL